MNDLVLPFLGARLSLSQRATTFDILLEKCHSLASLPVVRERTNTRFSPGFAPKNGRPRKPDLHPKTSNGAGYP